MTMPNDFELSFTIDGDEILFYSLERAEAAGLGSYSHLPKSLKVLGENLLRNCDKPAVAEEDICALGSWTFDPAMVREVVQQL